MDDPGSPHDNRRPRQANRLYGTKFRHSLSDPFNAILNIAGSIIGAHLGLSAGFGFIFAVCGVILGALAGGVVGAALPSYAIWRLVAG